MKRICVWPDGFWCELCDLEEMLNGRSDDFKVFTVQEDLEDEHIEDMIRKGELQWSTR